MTEEEIIIWLAGLISTDGNIHTFPGKKALQYKITSIEMDWLDLISNHLSSIGISSKPIPQNGNAFDLYLHQPRKVTKLLQKYALEFLSPRKRKIVEKAYLTNKHQKWTPEEDAFLSSNFSDEELVKKLGRSLCGIQSRRERLR